MHDLTKLHPIHQKTMLEHYATLKGVKTADGRDACDVLYEQYFDLNETVPDIIGKQEHQMTKTQKTRYKQKVKDLIEKSK